MKKLKLSDNSKDLQIIPDESIEHRIFLIRGQKIMLDSDLARLYGVSAKRLNEQVRRNIDRFPKDFMFQLTNEEYKNLRSQFATSSWGGVRYLPYAFTEHGVTMLSAVLKSPRAVQVSVFVVRAFIKLREMLATHKELAAKMKVLESEQEKQGQQLIKVLNILKHLLDEPVPMKAPIGFSKK
ncbi:MAG: ORF6N domain-containing protein [Candidatus Paceibacterota bacterium]|jgi:phage regulator Rha-like protein